MTSPWRHNFTANVSMASITALEFDPDKELMWACDSTNTLFSVNNSGRLYSSFGGASRLVSNIFFLDLPNEAERLVAVPDRDVVRCFKRGGMQAVCFPPPSAVTQVIENFHVSTETGAMFFTGGSNITRMHLTEEGPDYISVPCDTAVSMLRQHGDWLVSGSHSGVLTVRSQTTLKTVGQITASKSRVLAMDVHDNTILAVFSERTATGVLKVYDARNLSAPVTTVGDIPSGHLTHLKYFQNKDGKDSACVLASRTYHIAQLDSDKLVYSSTESSDSSISFTSLAISPSFKWTAIGTDKGSVATFVTPTEGNPVISTGATLAQPAAPKFAPTWKEVDMGKGFDPSVDPATFASAWPEKNYMILSVPHKLSCIQTDHYGMTVPNDWDVSRGQSYLPDSKEKLQSIFPNPYPFNSKLGDDPSKVRDLLLLLRKNMKHRTSRNGVYAPMEDALQLQYKLDWKACNEQPDRFAGLDNSFPECWITPILQCLYSCHAPSYPVRKAIMYHLCRREHCVTCEIAFIFSNMYIATQRDSGIAPIVQVGNLIRTMKQLRFFNSSDVFKPATSRDEAVARMHLMHRMVLERLHSDLQDQSSYSFPGHEMPWPDYQSCISRFFSMQVIPPPNTNYVPQQRFSWEIPSSALKVDEGLQHLLKQIEAENPRLKIEALPPILVLLLNPEHRSTTPLKTSATLRIQRDVTQCLNYMSNANVTHVADNVGDAGNFVSHLRSGDDEFTLINDYRVTSSKRMVELERMMPALSLCSEVVTYYTLVSDKWEPAKTRNEEFHLPNMWETLGPLLTSDILATPLPHNNNRTTFNSPLHSHKEIKAGDLIAIDAEYVNLRWDDRPGPELALWNARKPHMGLARLSCILSTKDGDERTIVDDYVHTPEEISDYVTQYSGIHPGDLELNSKKNLTTLKATYLKLRALVDAGVKFVGHGLTQDFRVCNISVPKRQIIDTLEIFHKSGQRYLSLRFLAYHVLNESVQENEHDSVEDARTSLRLYRKYLQLQREGLFEGVLDQLFAKRAESSWYVPDKVTYGDAPVTPPASEMGSPVFKVDVEAPSL